MVVGSISTTQMMQWARILHSYDFFIRLDFQMLFHVLKCLSFEYLFFLILYSYMYNLLVLKSKIYWKSRLL